MTHLSKFQTNPCHCSRGNKNTNYLSTSPFTIDNEGMCSINFVLFVLPLSLSPYIVTDSILTYTLSLSPSLSLCPPPPAAVASKIYLANPDAIKLGPD